mgnify:FL=1
MVASTENQPGAQGGRAAMRVLSIVLSAGALVGALLSTHCFSPALPACSYRCNTTEPRCPDEYECRVDGYCHLKGNSESCPFFMDLSPQPADLSTPGDMSATPDL